MTFLGVFFATFYTGSCEAFGDTIIESYWKAICEAYSEAYARIISRLIARLNATLF